MTVEVVEVEVMGRKRRRAKVTCDCGEVFVIMHDGKVCTCGQRYNLYGQRLRTR